MAWVKFPSITTADRVALTLLQREVVYDTDTDSLWYGDGATLGGIELGAAGVGGAWGSITGTLSAQTDLQTALDDIEALALAGL